MQQNQNPQDPQNPQVTPSNQTFVNSVPTNNASQNIPLQGNSIAKIIQLIWFVVGLINVILALRIVFLLFNAQTIGFTGFLYNVTAPFVVPFVGIFPAPSQGGTYFDTAALVAIVIYSLAAWGIATLIRIISSDQNSV
jgi:uncharacterized protein YggT (Ycf19 family)